jgi:hypothetical protein
MPSLEFPHTVNLKKKAKLPRVFNISTKESRRKFPAPWLHDAEIERISEVLQLAIIIE